MAKGVEAFAKEVEALAKRLEEDLSSVERLWPRIIGDAAELERLAGEVRKEADGILARIRQVVGELDPVSADSEGGPRRGVAPSGERTRLAGEGDAGDRGKS